MKKLLALLLVIALAIPFAACSTASDGDTTFDTIKESLSDQALSALAAEGKAEVLRIFLEDA